MSYRLFGSTSALSRKCCTRLLTTPQNIRRRRHISELARHPITTAVCDLWLKTRDPEFLWRCEIVFSTSSTAPHLASIQTRAGPLVVGWAWPSRKALSKRMVDESGLKTPAKTGGQR